MKYRQYIEENFLIDKAMTGQLVPFKFNPVQEHYYEDLCTHYKIEKYGISVPVRENIVKARREGFSSLILALFAADDLCNDNPTQTDVLSYKDDATETFRRRYRTYILSRFALEVGVSHDDIRNNINVLEEIAPLFLSVDSGEIELKHNQAYFQCNTASARVGGRGGVRHKILFSEIAFYPDTPQRPAHDIIEPTMRQVDIEAGWIFTESTENGVGTYQYRMWMQAQRGKSRFINRFYGASHFYTDDEIAVIKSEYVDMDSFRRDYPMTEEDLFKGSAKSFTTEEALKKMINVPTADKELCYFAEFQHQNSIDVAEIMNGELERLQRENPGYLLYVGIDEAKDVDATVMLVLRGRRRSITKGSINIEIDVTRGDFLADWFERNTRHFVKKVKFSRPAKSLMYSNLLVVIEDQLTEIPTCKIEVPVDPRNEAVHADEWVSDEHRHFWEQMRFLEKETVGRMLVVNHPKGTCNPNDHNYDECEYHDDYPDSWMMAEDIYVEINGVPRRKQKPVVSTVPDTVQTLLDKGTRMDPHRHRNRGETSYE
jgi:hypothetical protein